MALQQKQSLSAPRFTVVGSFGHVLAGYIDRSTVFIARKHLQILIFAVVQPSNAQDAFPAAWPALRDTIRRVVQESGATVLPETRLFVSSPMFVQSLSW